MKLVSLLSLFTIVATLGIYGCENTKSNTKTWDNIPDIIFQEMTNKDVIKYVGHNDLSWDKKVITVSFEDGDNGILELIEKTAQEWTDLGGDLEFSFRNSDGSFRKWTRFDDTKSSDIRISFRSGGWGGYWSTIGSLTKNVSPGHPTMNLDDFDQDLKQYLISGSTAAWEKSYEKSTILHEFGHALGLAHEHFHPKCQADMKMGPIIKDLMGPPNNWSEEKAKFNVNYAFYLTTLFDEGDIAQVPITSEHVDQYSLMLYGDLSRKFFKSGSNSPCLPLGPQGYATEISSQDREYYISQYRIVRTP